MSHYLGVEPFSRTADVCAMEMNRCPAGAEDLADDYCLNRLSTSAARRFEDHWLVCPRCAALVAGTQDLIDAFRMARGRP